jgi:hypothetical protein
MNLEHSRAIAMALIASAAMLGACDKKPGARTALAPDPSAQVIGTPPAPPTGDPPGTTPVSANTTTITKDEETTKKPQEGDNHSYSSVAENNPQKGDHKKDAQQTPERTGETK